ARDIALQVVAMNPASTEELLAQPFIKDGSVTIETLIKQLSGKIGERFVLSRFIRYGVGE
nr:elongation factor Ts [Candidatus Woesebacteria bacterium]